MIKNTYRMKFLVLFFVFVVSACNSRPSCSWSCNSTKLIICTDDWIERPCSCINNNTKHSLVMSTTEQNNSSQLDSLFIYH